MKKKYIILVYLSYLAAIDISSPKNRKGSNGSYLTSSITVESEKLNPAAHSGEGIGFSYSLLFDKTLPFCLKIPSSSNL